MVPAILSFRGPPAFPSPPFPRSVLGVQQKDFAAFLVVAWLISLSGFFCRWK